MGVLTLQNQYSTAVWIYNSTVYVHYCKLRGWIKGFYYAYCMATMLYVHTALLHNAIHVCSYSTVEILKSFDPPTHTINQLLYSSYVLYGKYSTRGVVLKAHTALGFASCCMTFSTTLLVPYSAALGTML